MWKYLLTFSIISFCESVPTGIAGTYNGLLLIQRWHKTSKSWTSQYDNYYSGRSSQIATYEHEWVIHGLWPLTTDSDFYRFCETGNGQSVRYDRSEMDTDFRSILKCKWPATSERDSEESVWKSEYQDRGSCVTTHTKFYFETAVDLLDNNNVGNILNWNSVYPGREYHLDRIVTALQEKITTSFYLLCVPAQNNKQYLMEVHICFTPGRTLKDCNHSPQVTNLYECVRNKNIIYELA